MTPFSLVVRKGYFDYPQRDSHAVRYFTFYRGGRGESVLFFGPNGLDAIFVLWREFIHAEICEKI
jgi:hypothetical protein